MSQQLNFAELKQRVSIVTGAKMLGLSLREDGDSLRCACPSCDGDNRSLSILEETGSFKCFKSNKYGSVLDLVCHIKGIGLREAGTWLIERENEEWLDNYADPKDVEEAKPDPVTLAPLTKLPKLNHDCDEVIKIGLDPDIAKLVGVGFTKVGLLKGCLGVPLYIDGEIVGYIGIPKGVWVKLPKNLLRLGGGDE